METKPLKYLHGAGNVGVHLLVDVDTCTYNKIRHGKTKSVLTFTFQHCLILASKIS